MRLRQTAALRACLIVLTGTGTTAGIAQQPITSPAAPQPTLRTRWADSLTPDRVLPAYPRPQLVRSRWTNLNGSWEYAIRDTSAGMPSTYDGAILVPFAVESQLSGVRRTVNERQYLWYKRTFAAPALRHGERLLLHFGAVDWRSTVYVNGHELVTHEGGYDPFSVDITDALIPSTHQTVIIRVWDPTDAGPQPRGKQVQKPENIYYTAVTGIWQTVWLEPVPASHIARLSTTTDIDAGTVTIRLTPDTRVSNTRTAKWDVTAFASGTAVARAAGRVGDALVLRLSHARMWSPADPFLYDLTVHLTDGSTRDTVTSYVGLRAITVMRDSAGVPRLALNHRILFQYGPLDQGWWPDGLYTAPTDAALRSDLEQTKRLGFNMIRKHVKVEPARWYYYADKLGLLVWQDMPAGDNNTAAGVVGFERELARMIDALREHPSIVMWVPFNEGWGQHDTRRITAWIKQYDPSRLADNASGWVDAGVGDVSDAHVYPGPGMPLPDVTRAMVLGEFGGLGLPIKGHLWVDQANWGYRTYTSTATLDSAYRAMQRQLRFMIGDGLSAAVYTQTTDVETEVNGLMTYDRAVVKLSPQAIADHALLYGPQPVRRAVMFTSRVEGQLWRYVTTAPDSTWMLPSFDDTKWQYGFGGFGVPVAFDYARMPEALRSLWATPDLWLRRTLDLPAAPLANPHWRIYHVDDAEVYVNGVLAGRFPGRTSGDVEIPLTDAARAALRPGRNTIAVHAHKAGALQYIDIGLDDVSGPVPPVH